MKTGFCCTIESWIRNKVRQRPRTKINIGASSTVGTFVLCLATIATAQPAADYPALVQFNTDPIGSTPAPGPLSTVPEYLVESPDGIFEVIDESLELEDRPVVLLDLSGAYQALGWTVSPPLDQFRCEADISLASYTNAYIFVSRDAEGVLVSRLEVHDDGTIRPSFPSTMILGTYSPGEPFRIRVSMFHSSTMYRVVVDADRDGYEDDVHHELPSISFQPFESIEFGYGWIPGTPTDKITMAAIDDVRLDYYPTRSVYLPFMRGDSNLNGNLDVMDAIGILESLWVPGTVPLPCRDAADSNDNGGIEVADAVFILTHYFVPYAPPPSSPYPECGPDPTEDLLDCAESSFCVPMRTPR